MNIIRIEEVELLDQEAGQSDPRVSGMVQVAFWVINNIDNPKIHDLAGKIIVNDSNQKHCGMVSDYINLLKAINDEEFPIEPKFIQLDKILRDTKKVFIEYGH